MGDKTLAIRCQERGFSVKDLVEASGYSRVRLNRMHNRDDKALQMLIDACKPGELKRKVLTPEQAAEIKRRALEMKGGKVMAKVYRNALAAEFGCTESTVKFIELGYRWQALDGKQ